LSNKTSMTKKTRQDGLLSMIKENPFLTDEEIAESFAVSVPTVRLDRLELGIPELRERIRNVAKGNIAKVRAITDKEIIGELIDINLGKNGISILETTDDMVFEKSRIVRGHFIYSLAESLAISVIDTNVALVGVANIKYMTPVYSGSKLVAKAEVRRVKENSFIVWVMISENQSQVFRGKFILISLDN